MFRILGYASHVIAFRHSTLQEAGVYDLGRTPQGLDMAQARGVVFELKLLGGSESLV